VFWWAGRQGNWDLYARCLAGDKWSKEIRLTDSDGPDVFPGAATDEAGRVWVAWQAFRDGNSDILARRQDGDDFGDPIVVADGRADDFRNPHCGNPSPPRKPCQNSTISLANRSRP